MSARGPPASTRRVQDGLLRVFLSRRRHAEAGARETQTGRAAVCEHTVYVVLLLSVEIRIQS